METEQQDIEELYSALTHPSNYYYERVRESLIWKYGYYKFREIQVKAFERIWE